MTMVASYRFGPFVVDAGSYQLRRGADVIPLSPKIIDLLLYLVARQSTLVTQRHRWRWDCISIPRNSAKTNPKTPARAAAVARQRMERGWVLLGFWRFVIGE